MFVQWWLDPMAVVKTPAGGAFWTLSRTQDTGSQAATSIRNDAMIAQHCYEQTYVSVVRTGTMELTGRSVSSSESQGRTGTLVYISTRSIK